VTASRAAAAQHALRLPQALDQEAHRRAHVLERFVRHSLGLKAPRSWGWLTSPSRAAYNRVYGRRTNGCRGWSRGGGSGSDRVKVRQTAGILLSVVRIGEALFGTVAAEELTVRVRRVAWYLH